MKAKIKANGAVIGVMHVMGGFKDIDSGIFYESEELDYPFFELEPKSIDWEQRRWDASVAAMRAQLSLQPTPSPIDAVGYAIYVADKLIEEFKKQKP